MDTDRAVHLRAIAMVLAGVIANPPVYRWQRVLFYQFLPGSLILPVLRQAQPGLNIFTCRACMVAGRKHVHIKRNLRTERAGSLRVGLKIGDRDNIFILQQHDTAFQNPLKETEINFLIEDSENQCRKSCGFGCGYMIPLSQVVDFAHGASKLPRQDEIPTIAALQLGVRKCLATFGLNYFIL